MILAQLAAEGAKLLLAAFVFGLYVYQTELSRILLCAWSHCRRKRLIQRTPTTPTKSNPAQNNKDIPAHNQNHTPPPLSRSESKRIMLLSTPTAYRRRQSVVKYANASCCDMTQTSCDDDSSSSRKYRMLEEARIPESFFQRGVELRDCVPTTPGIPDCVSHHVTPPRRHRRTSSLEQTNSALSSVSHNVRRKMLGRDRSWTAGVRSQGGSHTSTT